MKEDTMDYPQTVELGDRVEDRLTHFIGEVYAIANYRWGCRRIQVQPASLDKDGKPMDMSWFDEPELKVIKPAAAKPLPATGGPRDANPRRSDPS